MVRISQQGHPETAAMRRRISELTERLWENEVFLHQARVLTGKYHIQDHRLELSPAAAAMFGTPERLDNVPACCVDGGAVRGDEEDFLALYDAMARGDASGSACVHIRTEGGDFRLFDHRFTTVYDLDGEPVLGLLTLVDVTAGRECRLGFEKQSEVFDVLSEAIPGGIVFCYNRPGLPCCFINNGMLEAMGYSREDVDSVLGSETIRFIHPEERARVQALISEAIAGPGEFESRHRILRKDGSVGWVILRGRRGRDPHGHELIICVAVDVTEIVVWQDNLEEALARAEEATRIKSAFLANMSHEIRTPMNGVIGLSELALDDKTLSAKTRDFINKIRLSAAGLVDIINDILDVSKIESGRMELERTPFSLRDIFKQCETIAAVKADERGIVLDFSTRPRLDKKLLGDPTKLRQVLLNLLSNAIKFTERGTVKLAACAERRTATHITLEFSVKDTGIGMTEDEIHRVFEPFAQADNSTTRKYGGTGLGLAITKSLVELMGGTLEVSSWPGRGSRFHFTVELELSDEDESSHATRTREDERMPVFEGRVLVCEDNAINRQVIEEHLLRIGITPTMAANGAAGVEEVALRWREGNPPFDLILMDIHMPVMDGLDAARKIIRMGVQTPIIALTANVLERDRDTYLAAGMKDFLAKPFCARDLWNVLLRHIQPKEWIPLDRPQEARSTSARRRPGESTIIVRALALERAAGNEKLYRKIQSDFVKGHADTFARLNQAIDAGDFSHAHRIAHTLKGVANLIGSSVLAEAALAIEKGLENGKPEFNDEQMQTLGMTLNVVLEDLTAQLEEYERKRADTDTVRVRTTVDPAEVAALLDRLEPLLASGDSQSTDYLDEIREKLLPLGRLGKVLAEQVDGYDFEPALETVRKIRGKLKR
ncbi:MAG: ATP-binding protein [Planctomycetaceae bacterium]|nr:ATP-binding protein [Planctomycetaceae bacterium]